MNGQQTKEALLLLAAELAGEYKDRLAAPQARRIHAKKHGNPCFLLVNRSLFSILVDQRVHPAHVSPRVIPATRSSATSRRSTRCT